MILLENVSFSFKDGEILHDVNLEVKNGQFVGVSSMRRASLMSPRRHL